jgi:hypothetical protein
MRENQADHFILLKNIQTKASFIGKKTYIDKFQVA